MGTGVSSRAPEDAVYVLHMVFLKAANGSRDTAGKGLAASLTSTPASEDNVKWDFSLTF